MKRLPRRILALPILAIAAATTAPAAKSLEEIYFEDPVIEEVSLSPDGEYIAGIGYYKGERLLQTMCVSDAEIFRARTNKGSFVRGYTWESPENLIYWLGVGNRPVYLTNGAFFAYQKIRSDLKFPKPIFLDRETMNSSAGTPQPIDIVDALPGQPGKAIVAKWSETHCVLNEYDFEKGNFTELDRMETGKGSWYYLLNSQHIPVLRGFDKAADGELEDYWYKNDPTSIWSPFPVSEFGWPRLIHPNDRWVITEKHVDGPSIAMVFDMETGKSVGKPMSDPHFSVIAMPVRDNLSSTVLGMRYVTDRTKVIYFDPNYKKIQDLLQSRFPDMDVRIVGFYPKGELFLFSISSDVQPTLYKALLLRTGKINDLPFLDERPWITPEMNSPTKSLFYKSRDGVDIHAYLTVPKDREGPHPLLVMLHGGPQIRDFWGFDPTVQYFASLGLAVLQVNYRGSSGFGIPFRGGDSVLLAVQHCAEDTIDGIRHLIAEGIVDESRVGVFGWSFGGFGALSCATKDPDLFKFAIGCAGIYDYANFAERDRTHVTEWGEDAIERLYEDASPEELVELSPATHADKIKAKVFLYYGELDHRVNRDQVMIMEKALEKAGNPPEVVVESWGVHGLMQSRDEMKFYKRIRKFINSAIELE